MDLYILFSSDSKGIYLSKERKAYHCISNVEEGEWIIQNDGFFKINKIKILISSTQVNVE